MEIRNKIKASGLKATPQRRLVYQAMQKFGHASIDEVVAFVQSVTPDMHISTIYRIMESFCEVGLLSRIYNSEGKTYFDITPTEHHHFFTETGEIVDFEDRELTALIREKCKNKIGDGQTIKKVSIQIMVAEKTDLPVI
ncbi:MAG: transcriptional repressor [Bacteroidales bacterium]|nr:transcriptional repressor [Bacteroidales bacterium]MDD3201802.1 transcriptional repressor [Bacteroidales bacterium]